MSLTRLSNVCQRLSSTRFSSTVAMCCGKKFKTDSSMNRHKKLAWGKLRHRKNFCIFSKWEMGHRMKTTAKRSSSS